MPSSVANTSRILLLAAILVGGVSPLVYAQLTTEQDVQRTLEREGYQQVRDVNFTSEGITAKAVKDGKQVSLMLDPSGKIKQRY
jgi:hypothetical protein